LSAVGSGYTFSDDTANAAAYAPISHASNTSNPHSVTKSQVGLGNVDNTSDANKPISTAAQAALDLRPVVSRLSADWSNSTTTATNIGISFTVSASGGISSFECMLVTDTTDTSTALRVGVIHGTITSYVYTVLYEQPLGTTADEARNLVTKTNPTQYTAGSTSAGTSPQVFIIRGSIVNNDSSSRTFQLKGKSNNSSAVNVRAGSYCLVY
jgi:hypothetical protein